jgi:hypothetical protein
LGNVGPTRSKRSSTPDSLATSRLMANGWCSLTSLLGTYVCTCPLSPILPQTSLPSVQLVRTGANRDSTRLEKARRRDVSKRHARRPLPRRSLSFSSGSLGWLRRQDSFSSSERRSLCSRRSLSSRRCCSSSREGLSRSSSRLRLSVMLPCPLRLSPRWAAHPRMRLTICLAPLPMSPAQTSPGPRPRDL